MSINTSTTHEFASASVRDKAQQISSQLLRWYDTHGRTLPWRQTRDPYKILVSEIMLQQTQVARVIDSYHAWLAQFPSWNALANATVESVIRAWSGLGYNRRALMLRRAAQHVVAHGVPTSPEQWMRLPGVGPYTSAAVSVFAQHAPVLPVDTNIRRVLGRSLLGIAFPHLEHDELIKQHESYLMNDQSRFFDIPQALFDLASLICFPKTPECTRCPLQKLCVASSDFLEGRVIIPKRTVKKPQEYIREGKQFPNRIYRGRILKLVREHNTPIVIHTIGSLIDPVFDPIADVDWIELLVRSLCKDGLVEFADDDQTAIRLPRA